MRRRRRYSDEERAAALAALKANGGNLSRTARQAGVPLSTLQRWRDSPDAAATPKLRNEKKEELSALFEKVARLYLGQAAKDAVIEDTKGKDAVIAAATATDKMRLLNDESTENLDISNLTDEQRAERLRGLAERIRRRRVGAADAG